MLEIQSLFVKAAKHLASLWLPKVCLPLTSVPKTEISRRALLNLSNDRDNPPFLEDTFLTSSPLGVFEEMSAQDRTNIRMLDLD